MRALAEPGATAVAYPDDAQQRCAIAAALPPASRAAFFFPGLGGGGIEVTMLRLAGAFAARGYPTDVVVGRARGPLEGEVPAGVQVVDLAAPRMLRTLPGLVRYLRAARPAVVIAAPDHMSTLAVAARAAARSAARVVATVHNNLTARSAGAGVKLRVQAAAARRALPRAGAVVAVSEGVAADLAANHGVPGDKLSVVYNPLPIAEIAAAAAEPLDHPWFMPEQPPVVLGVGRLAPQKDFATLLRGFAGLRAGRPARLVVLGEGPERARLERLAAELGVAGDVELPGFAANPHRFMARAGVFALTSAYEGFGIVVAEALACGAPVVATDCPSGPAEILEGGRYGRLVPVGDPAALAAALAAALDEPPRPPPDGALDRFRLDVAVAGYLAAAGAAP